MRTTITPSFKPLAFTILATVLSGCLSNSSSGDAASATKNQAATSQGPVEGVIEDSMITFKGIPFAAPPVGELRFSPPAPPVDRGGKVLLADTYSSPCMQPPNLFESAPSSEDCLYLNVFTPDIEGDYPVMVWIHGGSLETGSGGPSYNPVRLVERGVTVVTINYRLGVLGFMAHQALSDASDSTDSGNYGLLDQQAALAWLRENIGAFGGDPDNITLFGESAGGHSVLTHLASPSSADLFDKAIVQSGSYAPDQRSLDVAEARGKIFADYAGCTTDVVQCLRGLTAEELISAQRLASTETSLGTGFLPVMHLPTTGTSVLPLSISEAIDSGQFNWKPTLMGSNLDEWRLFVGIYLLGGGQVTDPNYTALIRATTGVDAATAESLAALYPPANYASPAEALSALGTDAVFACNLYDQLQKLSPLVPTYGYEFSDRDAPLTVPEVPGFDFGAAHSLEIGYLLADESLMVEFGATPGQIALADHMADYWTTFAKYGDPNPASGVSPIWPAYEKVSGPRMIRLVPPTPDTLTAASFNSAHKCDTWLAP